MRTNGLRYDDIERPIYRILVWIFSQDLLTIRKILWIIWRLILSLLFNYKASFRATGRPIILHLSLKFSKFLTPQMEAVEHSPLVTKPLACFNFLSLTSSLLLFIPRSYRLNAEELVKPVVVRGGFSSWVAGQCSLQGLKVNAFDQWCFQCDREVVEHLQDSDEGVDSSAVSEQGHVLVHLQDHRALHQQGEPLRQKMISAGQRARWRSHMCNRNSVTPALKPQQYYVMSV